MVSKGAMKRPARAALAACGIYACTYAWSIGATTDSGTDGTVAEAGPDVAQDDVDAPDSGEDAPVVDSPPPRDTNADCQGLLRDLDAARVTAKICYNNPAVDCLLRATTECKCETWVETTVAQSDYNAKAAAVAAAGCAQGCTACIPLGDASHGLCLASGPGVACSP